MNLVKENNNENNNEKLNKQKTLLLFNFLLDNSHLFETNNILHVLLVSLFWIIYVYEYIT